jgi:hypothetical protein
MPKALRSPERVEAGACCNFGVIFNKVFLEMQDNQTYNSADISLQQTGPLQISVAVA